MNINNFKASLDKRGALARPNLFMVEITNSSSSHIEEESLRFFCKNVQIPSLSVTTHGYKPYTIGPEQNMPTGIQFEPVNCIFMMDSDHTILSFFHNWFQKIVNYNTSSGTLSSVDGMYPYEIGYKEEYSVSMRIKFFGGPLENNFYEVNFEEVFPTNIGSVSLAWEENDSYATLPVSFSYSGMSFSSTISGSSQERFSRSNGLVEKIASLIRAQSVNQSSFPSNVQSAIDRFSRLKNTFNEFKRTL